MCEAVGHRVGRGPNESVLEHVSRSPCVLRAVQRGAFLGCRFNVVTMCNRTTLESVAAIDSLFSSWSACVLRAMQRGAFSGRRANVGPTYNRTVLESVAG